MPLWNSERPKRNLYSPQLDIPELSTGLCFEPAELQSFLKKSRDLSDDTVKKTMKNTAKQDCRDLIQRVLVPAWQQRSHVLQYCSSVARDLRMQQAQEAQEAKPPAFDLRVNPYAEEEYENEQQKKHENLSKLENWVRNEEGVEKIVISRSFSLLYDGCFKKEVDEFKEWRG